MRFRSAEKIVKQAWEGLHSRRRIGLVGPTVTDHPQINEILTALNEMNAEITISSLRIDTLTESIINELAKGKLQTITVAPEAGSQRLRDVTNKCLTEDDILKAVDLIAGQRFTQLKLYFIVGLPTETDEDVEEIVRLTLAIKNRLESKRSNIRIVVNAAPFVPKASTPFQWLPMAPEEILNRRLSILRSRLPLQGIKLNEEGPAWSRVQGVLSRGDEKIAPVLTAMKEISLSAWKKAIEQHGLDVESYVNRRFEPTQKLPWSVIDSGMKEEKLLGEMERAVGT